MNPRVDVVAEEHARLGEGAFWDWGKQVLYWVDIDNGRLHIHEPRTGRNRCLQVGGKIGTVVPIKSGGVLLALTHSLAAFNPETGELRRLASLEADIPENRSNDGKCDPAGRLWVGTMAPDEKPGGASLYRFDADCSLRKVFSGVTISNGIAWSRDATKMYYIDTPTRQVNAFDFTLGTGEIRNRRVCIEIPESRGFPDGMTMDEEGMLWIALFGGHGVSRWDPTSGAMLDYIEVPARNVTSCAFGGADLDELYVTSGRILLSDVELAGQPEAGNLFRVKPGVRGVPLPAFAG